MSILLATSSFSAINAKAENTYGHNTSGAHENNTKIFDYQGEVSMRYGFGIDYETNNINLEIVNGVRFSRYFYAGIGIGASTNFSDEAGYIPLYLDLKGYLPVSETTELTAGIDLGTQLDFFYGTSGGFLLRPEFGVNFPLNGNKGLNVTLFYEMYKFTENIMDDVNINMKTNQIGLKIGFSF